MEEATRRHGRRLELGLGGAGGEADLISALPEDLLLQVLDRLRCARAAARTSLLCRRWRGLWVHLPDFIFRNVPLVSLLPALSSLEAAVGPGPGPGVSLLDIRVLGHGSSPGRVSSLLHAAAVLSPIDFRLDLPRELSRVDVDFSRFRRATSIHLYVPSLCLMPPRPSGGFAALERLTLWVSVLASCFYLSALVLSCPCLRVLRVAGVSFDSTGINIRSESLQELYVRTSYGSTACINVETPLLKKLTLHFHPCADLSVSVVAPNLEKVSWECSYYMTTVVLGPWCLDKVSLGQRAITGPGVDTCLQPSNVLFLSLKLPIGSWLDEGPSFVQQIEKHLVTDFSGLELTMDSTGSVRHVFGMFVFHLLGMHQIRTAIQRFKIICLRSKVKIDCSVTCPCDEPKNWRSENISLINLEEVEIEGFEGNHHDFDLLKLIFRCTPKLKRMVVRMSDEDTPCNDRCTKIYDIFKAYPFVECSVDLSYGSMHCSQSYVLT